MVHDRITKIPKRRSPNDADYIGKKFPKISKNCGFFPILKFWNFFSSRLRLRLHLRCSKFMWVIFDCEQDGKKISNSNFLVFLGIRFETHQTFQFSKHLFNFARYFHSSSETFQLLFLLSCSFQVHVSLIKYFGKLVVGKRSLKK